MRHAYLALFDMHSDESGMWLSEATFFLESHGLQHRWRSGLTALYAAAGTPIIDLGSGTVLIGELHSRDGECIQHRHQLPDLHSISMLSTYILSQCWGDYVLLQPIPGDSCALEVLRSPSHACELPCLYSASDTHAFITSDINLAFGTGLHRRRIDFENLVHRLVYPDIKLAASALIGVNELLPGHSVTFCRAGATVTRKWDPWTFVQPQMRYQHLDQAIAAVRSSVQRVTKALADRHRSVLIELSGGLDSSIVATSLRASSANVHCATMMSSFPGADERDYAAVVAEMLGATLIESELRLDDAAFAFDLPPELASPSVGPLQYGMDGLMQSSAHLSGADAGFCGAGGDSVFCYLSTAAPAADAYLSAGPLATLRTIQDLAAFHQCTYWRAGILTVRKLLGRYPQPDVDLSLLNPNLSLPEPKLHAWDQRPPDALPGDSQRIHELAGAQSFQDSCLRRSKRPLRMPLLSQPVIETCLRVPSWMWFASGQNRAVARLAFSDQLPDKVIARRSKGSLTAYLGALHRRRRQEIVRFLADGQLQAKGLLDADALIRMRDQDHTQEERAFLRLFQLCMLENWVRQQTRFT